MRNYQAGRVYALHKNKQTEVTTMEWKTKTYKTHDEAQAAAVKLDAPIKAVHKSDDGWVLEWSDANYQPKKQKAAKPKKTKSEKYDDDGMYTE